MSEHNKFDKHYHQLIDAALDIKKKEAIYDNSLGFLARSLLIASLPHRDPKTQEFRRSNGSYQLMLYAPSHVGLPYGNIPRLLSIWMTTEAICTNSHELYLGRSLAAFMEKLGLQATGGKNGSINRFKEQLKRLSTVVVSCTWESDQLEQERGFRLVSERWLWWDVEKVDFSKIVLSKDFFEEIRNSPVPLDLRAVKALKRSCLALDIYCWLTYRMSYLKRPTTIQWGTLQEQFGVGYPHTLRGRLDFKRKFKQQLKRVLIVYPDAKVEEVKEGITLRPSRTHIRKC